MKYKFPLVTAIDGEARASTEVIAYGLGQNHSSVIKLVRRYLIQFKRFGHVDFKSEMVKRKQGGGAKREFAMLNEHQAALLISFMRNSPKVVEFKVALIEEFFRMREELQYREKSLWAQLQALVAKDEESKVRASFGSRLMLERKRQIPILETERERIEAELQPELFIH